MACSIAKPERHPDLRKLEKRLLRQIGKAIGDYDLIREGDRIAVAVSGGKDSWTMLEMLERLRKRAPVRFSLVAVHVDQGFKDFQYDLVADYLAAHGFEYRVYHSNSYQLIEDKIEPGVTYCSFCARIRRGVLYRAAKELGCNKIALGHHSDDAIETLLLNILYQGRLAAMPPKLKADDGISIVIRPLIYASEQDLATFAYQLDPSTRKPIFPIVCCNCPVCGDDSLKRRRIKKLLLALEKEIPTVKHSLLSSLGNVHLSHLMDRDLWSVSETSEGSSELWPALIKELSEDGVEQ
ncbi:MAG: tRNA 2-thiocytidine(32) synthetase TtcA [Acidobacteriia bacterium]|nr:tRNA 2-thiocytidine(32) synthetase TtcA [Terriglobia bacterium]